MAAFPLALVAMRRHALLALVPSLLLWSAVQIWDINLAGYPGDREWYFNPFAWQLLFVIAAYFGFRQARGLPPLLDRDRLLPAAAAVALIGCVVQATNMLHELFDLPLRPVVLPLWAVDKTPLPPLRLLSMLAIALLVARLVPRNARFLTSRPGWVVVLCGQKSLYVFCLSILLSVLGNAVVTSLGGRLAAQVAANVAGIALLVGFGLLLSWYGGGGRLPARPAPGEVAA